jgi:Ca2+-binding RTX toxin-like protein
MMVKAGEKDSLDININNVVGGTGADYIDASLSTGVKHILYGMSGDDTLIGSDLADTLYGGWGNDTLKGGSGTGLALWW